MKYRIDKVNSWNGWDPLKQVMLGNCFSPDWFRDIKDTSLRKMIQSLTADTMEDLDGIQRTLENLGVDVVRIPENTIENGMNLDDDGIDFDMGMPDDESGEEENKEIIEEFVDDGIDIDDI